MGGTQNVLQVLTLGVPYNGIQKGHEQTNSGPEKDSIAQCAVPFCTDHYNNFSSKDMFHTKQELIFVL